MRFIHILLLMNLIQSAPRWRSQRAALAALLTILLVAQGAALYSRLTSTSAVNQADVLAEYRARQGKIQPAATATAITGGPSTSAIQQQAEIASAASAGSGRTPQKSGQPGSAASDCDWACPTALEAPEAGVYSYFQCARTSGQCTGSGEPEGWEEISGVRRTFNRQGERYVAVSSQRQWNNVHFYAEEHEEEFDLSIDETGVYDSRYKVVIRFGGLPGGVDIRMEPPFKITEFPIKLGSKWSGSWTDTNGGANADYTSEVVGKEELTVAGRSFRTWVITHHINFKGPEVTGTADLKFWLSPELRTPVQEFYDQKLQTPRGSYVGFWMVTLSNSKPKQ